MNKIFFGKTSGEVAREFCEKGCSAWAGQPEGFCDKVYLVTYKIETAEWTKRPQICCLTRCETGATQGWYLVDDLSTEWREIMREIENSL